MESKNLYQRVTPQSLLGIVCGTLSGLVAGVLVASMIGYCGRWTRPEDPSSGSGAIIVIATAPIGAISGFILGGKYPRHCQIAFIALVIVLIIWNVMSSD